MTCEVFSSLTSSFIFVSEYSAAGLFYQFQNFIFVEQEKAKVCFLPKIFATEWSAAETFSQKKKTLVLLLLQSTNLG